jgi:hypothetical protein
VTLAAGLFWRYGDGMKRDARTRSHAWWTIVLCAVLMVYQGSHYATATVVHFPGMCMGCEMHGISGKPFPPLIDDYFFWPAERFDELFGIRPWDWR